MNIEIAKQLVGKLVYSWFAYKNRHFSSVLKEIRGGEILIFEDSHGRTFVNRLSEIAGMYEIEPVI